MHTHQLGRLVAPMTSEVMNDLCRYGIQVLGDLDGNESMASNDRSFFTRPSLTPILDRED